MPSEQRLFGWPAETGDAATLRDLVLRGVYHLRLEAASGFVPSPGRPASLDLTEQRAGSGLNTSGGVGGVGGAEAGPEVWHVDVIGAAVCGSSMFCEHTLSVFVHL